MTMQQHIKIFAIIALLTTAGCKKFWNNRPITAPC